MDVYFLIFSLFFPRIVLLVYLFLDHYPHNTVPFLADIFLGVFIPRVLILIYIYQTMGADNVWFAAHMIVMIMTYFGGGRETVRRRRIRRSS